MIVHDEGTLEEALQILAASPEGVRYSDEYAYIIITQPHVLEDFCTRALRRNDIAIVVAYGHESEMESHARNVGRIRRKRAEDEKESIKRWVREHPEAVERVERKMKRTGE